MSCANSGFLFLPTVGQAFHYELVASCAGVAAIAVAVASLSQFSKKLMTVPFYCQIYVIGATVFSALIVLTTSRSIEQKRGLPVFNQLISWLLSFSAILTPLLSSDNVLQRLLLVIASLYIPFVLLSTGFEALFYLTLGLQLCLWVALETDSSCSFRLHNVSHIINEKSSTHNDMDQMARETK